MTKYAWRSDGDPVGHFDYCSAPGSHSSILTWCSADDTEPTIPEFNKSTAYYLDHPDKAPFLASVNVPGYLPEQDPIMFEDAGEAWNYLKEERDRLIDEAIESDLEPFDSEDEPTLREIVANMVKSDKGEPVVGTVHGSSYNGSLHDLGLNYTVQRLSVE